MLLRFSVVLVFMFGAAQAYSLLAERFRHRRDATRPDIRYLHIKTDIAYRFATTKVASLLANKDRKAREAVFTIQLPKAAFITEFSMTIENIVYNGTVKAKEVARKEYIEARRRGQSAGHVAAKTRNANKFDVSVNVAPQQKVTFNLTYQELLQRSLGMYQNVMYINPGQIVQDLKVDVFINESREITTIRVPELKKDVEESINSLEDNEIAVVEKSSPSSVHIKYYPTSDQQKGINAQGLTGQFIVQYEVARDFDGGDIQVVDGYFVHFFAPSGLEPVKKNVIFILDISGSMSGKKIQQVKEAMKVILRDLQAGDLFNIILFDSRIELWNSTNLLEVNEANLQAAESYVLNMRTRGATDINGALIAAINFLDDTRQQEKALNPSSIIVFLTDGDPTSGVTNVDTIQQNVRNANEDRYSIFSLGFGDGVDFGFLRKISLQNNGIARKIYEDSDATLQLQGFYKEISTPLLTDVNVKYLDVGNTTKMTRTVFPNYFNGSEIVICGFLHRVPREDSLSPPPMFRAIVQGNSNDRTILIEKELDMTSKTGLRASTEKLWAYLTIKDLLDRMETVTNSTEKAEVKAEALRLSLKYSFVTPLTSMIVKKPDQNATRADLEASNGRPENEMHDVRRTMTGSYQPSFGASGLPGAVGLSGPVLYSQPRRRYKQLGGGGRPQRPTYMPLPAATYSYRPRPTYRHRPRPTMMARHTTTTTTTTTTTGTTHAPRTPTTSVTILRGSPSLLVEVSDRRYCVNLSIDVLNTTVPLFSDSRRESFISGQFDEVDGQVVLTHIILKNRATRQEVMVNTRAISHTNGVSTWGNMRSHPVQYIDVLDTNTIRISRNYLSRSISLDITRNHLSSGDYLVMKLNWRRRSRLGLGGILSNFLPAKMSGPLNKLESWTGRLVQGTTRSTRVQDVHGADVTCNVDFATGG